MPVSSGTGNVSDAAFLSALQNVVTALNSQVQNATYLAGTQDFFNLTSATLVKSGAGRIAKVSVIVVGSAAGTVYDATSVTDTSRPIYKVTFAATGIQIVDLPFQYGLLVVPGTGQTLAGSFS